MKTSETSTGAGLKDVRKSLHETGMALLQAATAAIEAAAKDTRRATNAVIEAAEESLAAAEVKVRKVRAQLRTKK